MFKESTFKKSGAKFGSTFLKVEKVDQNLAQPF
jgi:hypothetical protein